MIIGDRLREMREAKKLSQGDIEKGTGLLRCYISRVENGHTIPAVETLEKFAHAFEMPLYHLLYEGDEPPQASASASQSTSEDALWGSFGKDARFLGKLRRLLPRMQPEDRSLLLCLLEKMAHRRRHKSPQYRCELPRWLLLEDSRYSRFFDFTVHWIISSQ
ncbi:MAG: helix-turn-helix transcriptional regulator [Acidobacteria bacterium]|nr:helix-turn-helix transcriptional regulator [Acidobacteriota bacterium]